MDEKREGVGLTMGSWRLGTKATEFAVLRIFSEFVGVEGKILNSACVHTVMPEEAFIDRFASSVHLWRRCDTLCASGFVDDVMFARNCQE